MDSSFSSLEVFLPFPTCLMFNLKWFVHKVERKFAKCENVILCVWLLYVYERGLKVQFCQQDTQYKLN